MEACGSSRRRSVACLLLAGCQTSDHGSRPASPRPRRPVDRGVGAIVDLVCRRAGRVDRPRVAVGARRSAFRPHRRGRRGEPGGLAGDRQAPTRRTSTPSAAPARVLTQSYGIRHPSQPNYLALFSGSTQGLTDDSCPHTYRTPNLGAQLLGPRAHLRRLLRVTAVHRGPELFGRSVRAQARAVGRLRQPAGLGQPSAEALAHGLVGAADRRVRDPEPGPRHARRDGAAGRHLAANPSGRVRNVGPRPTTACWSSPGTRTTSPRGTASPASWSART